MLHLGGHTATVLTAAGAHFFMGWLWYSEYLFGPMWKKMGGKCTGFSKDMRVNLALSFASSLLLAVAAVIAISIFEKTQTSIYSQEGLSKLFSWFLDDSAANNTMLGSMKTIAFLWAGLSVPLSAKAVIWSAKPWRRWLLEQAGCLASLLALAGAVAAMS